MNLLQRYQWLLFLSVLCIATVFFLVQIWSIKSLYFSADVRSRTEQTVRRIADERGWLLSDTSLTFVNSINGEICHRDHLRGPDTTVCEFFVLPAQ